jgi:hypothetical protein
MKVLGTYIGCIFGHTENIESLNDRCIEMYIGKTKIKFILYKSSTIGWGEDCNIIEKLEIKKEDNNLLNNITSGLDKLAEKHNIILSGSRTYMNNLICYENGVNKSRVLCATKESVRQKTIECLENVYPTLIEKLDYLLDSGAINFNEHDDNYNLPKIIVQALGETMSRLYCNPYASKADKRELKNIKAYI